MSSKRKTIETYVLPSVLYAAETIAWKHPLQQKVTVFLNHLMRWMTGHRLRDKTKITDLHITTGLQPIMRTIRKRKLQWYGHIKRSQLPVKSVFEGLSEGKRSRPQEWTNKSWSELNLLARNRERWRAICSDV